LPDKKKRAPRNRTITLTEKERASFKMNLLKLDGPIKIDEILNRTIYQNLFDILDWLPTNSIDLLFADPPYNLTKTFNSNSFNEISLSEYEAWLDSWLSKLVQILRPTASVYICGDWRSSTSIHRVIRKYFIVQNRITWEREKGRGAKNNWKNCSEDGLGLRFGQVINDFTYVYVVIVSAIGPCTRLNSISN